MKLLPRVVTLPNKFRIQIRIVDALTLADKFGKDCDGAWVKGERTIFILEDQSNAQKWYTLAHELQHAVTDWTDDLLINGVAKV